MWFCFQLIKCGDAQEAGQAMVCPVMPCFHILMGSHFLMPAHSAHKNQLHLPQLGVMLKIGTSSARSPEVS